MFFRQMLMSGATRLLAPEDDQGSEFDEPDDIDPGEEQDEPDDQDGEDPDEPDDTEDRDEPDDEGDEPPPQRQAAPRKPFSQRVNEVAERKAAEIVQRELAAFRAQQQTANQPPAETPAQLQARLAQMEPWERAETIAQMTAANVQAQLNQMRWESQESADKTAFDALCAREPSAAKLRTDVERQLNEMRAQGSTAPRETIYTYLLGQRARQGATRATNRAGKAADANRARQTTRPPAGRGDTPASNDRGNNLSAVEKRLLNVQL